MPLVIVVDTPSPAGQAMAAATNGTVAHSSARHSSGMSFGRAIPILIGLIFEEMARMGKVVWRCQMSDVADWWCSVRCKFHWGSRSSWRMKMHECHGLNNEERALIERLSRVYGKVGEGGVRCAETSGKTPVHTLWGGWRGG